VSTLFALICWGSVIAFLIYWHKQRKARLNAGESYQIDETYLNIAKRKKQIGIVFIISLILYISPKLLVLIGIVAFFAFLYYWRKKISARKEAGDNYMHDEKYLHISKVKRIVGVVCVVSLILGIIIPNNQEIHDKNYTVEEQQKINEALIEFKKVQDLNKPSTPGAGYNSTIKKTYIRGNSVVIETTDEATSPNLGTVIYACTYVFTEKNGKWSHKLESNKRIGHKKN